MIESVPICNQNDIYVIYFSDIHYYFTCSDWNVLKMYIFFLRVCDDMSDEGLLIEKIAENSDNASVSTF